MLGRRCRLDFRRADSTGLRFGRVGNSRGPVPFGPNATLGKNSQIVGFAGCATLYDNPDINGSHGGNKGLFDAKLTEKTAFTVYLEKTNAKIYGLRTRDYHPDQVLALNKNAVATMEQAANPEQ